MSHGDLDLAANYLAQQYARGSARVVLEGDDARVIASVPVPKSPLRNSINVDTVLTGATPLPRIKRLQLGRVPIPGGIADWLLRQVVIQAFGDEAFRAGVSAVKKLDMRNGRVAVTYDWHPDLKDNIRNALLSPEDRARHEIYQRRLSEVTRTVSSSNLELTQLLSHAFRLAQERSRHGGPIG